MNYEKKFLTTQEAANATGYTLSSIKRFIHTKKLRAVKRVIKRKVRFFGRTQFGHRVVEKAVWLIPIEAIEEFKKN